MLAECYGRVGDEEQRLDALRRVAEGDRGPDSARIELAQALAASGKLDQAVTILLPLAASEPEWRLDLVRLLLQKTIRQPRDQRNWQEVERYLHEAEKALPQDGESIALLRLDMLAAQGRLEDARSRSLVGPGQGPPEPAVSARAGPADPAARARVPRPCRSSTRPRRTWGRASTFNWLAWTTGAWRVATRPRPRWRSWRRLASRSRRPTGPRSSIGSARRRSGSASRTSARQYWRELAALQPDNLRVRLGLFDLAVAAGDHDAAASLVDEIRKIEGDEGTTWRFAQAALLIDKVRRGVPRESGRSARARRKSPKRILSGRAASP